LGTVTSSDVSLFFRKRKRVFIFFFGNIYRAEPPVNDCLLLFYQEKNDIQKEFVKMRLAIELVHFESRTIEEVVNIIRAE
jgi:hypothetical protein